MTRKLWLIVLAGLALGVHAGGEARAEDAAPTTEKKGYWVASETIQINATAEQVFRYTGNLPNWQQWTAWNDQKDPTGVWAYKGDPGTVGHEMSWDGPVLGQGRMVFTKVEGSTVHYDLFFGKSKTANGGYIAIAGADPVSVTWYTDGKLKGMTRLFKKKIEAGVGKDFEDGLAKLKPLVEAVAVAEAHAAKVAAASAAVAAEKATLAALEQTATTLRAEAEAAVKAADEALAAAKKPAQKKAAGDAKAAAEAKKSEAEKAAQAAKAQADNVQAKQAELDALNAAAPKG